MNNHNDATQTGMPVGSTAEGEVPDSSPTPSYAAALGANFPIGTLTQQKANTTIGNRWSRRDDLTEIVSNMKDNYKAYHVEVLLSAEVKHKMYVVDWIVSMCYDGRGTNYLINLRFHPKTKTFVVDVSCEEIMNKFLNLQLFRDIPSSNVGETPQRINVATCTLVKIVDTLAKYPEVELICTTGQFNPSFKDCKEIACLLTDALTQIDGATVGEVFRTSPAGRRQSPYFAGNFLAMTGNLPRSIDCVSVKFLGLTLEFKNAGLRAREAKSANAHRDMPFAQASALVKPHRLIVGGKSKRLSNSNSSIMMTAVYLCELQSLEDIYLPVDVSAPDTMRASLNAGTSGATTESAANCCVDANSATESEDSPAGSEPDRGISQLGPGEPAVRGSLAEPTTHGLSTDRFDSPDDPFINGRTAPPGPGSLPLTDAQSEEVAGATDQSNVGDSAPSSEARSSPGDKLVLDITKLTPARIPENRVRMGKKNHLQKGADCGIYAFKSALTAINALTPDVEKAVDGFTETEWLISNPFDSILKMLPDDQRVRINWIEDFQMLGRKELIDHEVNAANLVKHGTVAFIVNTAVVDGMLDWSNGQRAIDSPSVIAASKKRGHWFTVVLKIARTSGKRGDVPLVQAECFDSLPGSQAMVRLREPITLALDFCTEAVQDISLAVIPLAPRRSSRTPRPSSRRD
jgi:hypothetical protein